MKGPVSALFSEYIIDGVQMEFTPAMMLDECITDKDRRKGSLEKGRFMPVVDESVDPLPYMASYDRGRIYEYLDGIRRLKVRWGRAPEYPDFCSRSRIASCLLSLLWNEGHFRLDDLVLDAVWRWDIEGMGNMAKFYESVESAGQYLYDLGVPLSSYAYEESGCFDIIFSISSVRQGSPVLSDSYDFEDNTAGARSWISCARKCPAAMSGDRSSWLIYVPFDSCPHRLGGSMLAEVSGNSSESAPELRDPDYFMDCFEVVRELVEDGVVMAGYPVGDGGLIYAEDLFRSGRELGLDISGIRTSYLENDPVRILFSEIPGVLIQISDDDYDYVDSQFLLQDVAYYPVAHPGNREGELSVVCDSRSGVSSILQALIQGQASEGED